MTTPVPYSTGFQYWSTTETSAYLGVFDAFHGQHIHLGHDAERRFEFCTDKRGSDDLDQLWDFSTGWEYALECHIAGGTICADICLGVIDSEYAVRDVRADETVSLAVPVKS